MFERFAFEQRRRGLKAQIGFLSFLALLFSAIVIAAYTSFVVNKIFELILLFTIGVVTIPFTLFLWRMIKTKKIDYNLDSIQAYVGFAGTIILFFSFLYASIAYPVPYLIHKIIKKSYQSDMIVTRMEKTSAEGLRIGLSPYHMSFHNDDFQSDLHFGEYALYQNVKENDTIKLFGYQSIFGYTIDSIAYKKD